MNPALLFHRRTDIMYKLIPLCSLILEMALLLGCDSSESRRLQEENLRLQRENLRLNNARLNLKLDKAIERKNEEEEKRRTGEMAQLYFDLLYAVPCRYNLNVSHGIYPDYKISVNNCNCKLYNNDFDSAVCPQCGHPRSEHNKRR